MPRPHPHDLRRIEHLLQVPRCHQPCGSVGGSHVWKVGPKVFAIGGWDNGKYPGVTFKVSEIAYEILSGRPGLRPAPYLASRGMKWVLHYADPGLPDDELKTYLVESHNIVSLGLKKAEKATWSQSGKRHPMTRFQGILIGVSA